MHFPLPPLGLVASLVASFLDGLRHPHPLLLAGCSVFGMPLGPGRGHSVVASQLTPWLSALILSPSAAPLGVSAWRNFPRDPSAPQC